MLDVHPPQTAVHGWRDFFIHIATNTRGETQAGAKPD
jgi:hypothetical protein